MSISKHLGQQSQYPTGYDSSVLVTELRQSNRDIHNINPNIFGAGMDVWNIYEVSFLTLNGLPINGVGKLIYPSTSDSIVESKSLKLYFFSYNMYKIADTVEGSIQQFEAQVIQDLSKLLEVEVQFKFFNTTNDIPRTNIFKDYISIDNEKQLEHVIFTEFEEANQLLKIIHQEVSSTTIHHEKITTSALRSACKITKQPDFGDLFIEYTSRHQLDTISLIEYIVSFRNEFHFHEEVVEMIFKALYTVLDPISLTCTALYTRRGGLDINPIRSTHTPLINKVLISPNELVQKTNRQ